MSDLVSLRSLGQNPYCLRLEIVKHSLRVKSVVYILVKSIKTANAGFGLENAALGAPASGSILMASVTVF